MTATSEDARRVPVFLTGAKITEGFRKALFEASSRAGSTPSEFALMAAAEKLISAGHSIPGIFRLDDFNQRGAA